MNEQPLQARIAPEPGAAGPSMPWSRAGAATFSNTGTGELAGELSGAAAAPREAVTHEAKTLPVYFSAISEGTMPFDVRSSDRDFAAGDQLRLIEWDVSRKAGTGRRLDRRIISLLDLPGGLIVLGLAPGPSATLAQGPQQQLTPTEPITPGLSRGIPPARELDGLPVLNLPLVARIQAQEHGLGSEIDFVDASDKARSVPERVWLITEMDALRVIDQITAERDYWKFKASESPQHRLQDLSQSSDRPTYFNKGAQ